VNPDLVAHDEEGKPYTVRYEAVNAMLLNEFLKEHRTVEEQQSTITELKSAVAEQRKQIESLTGAVEKISARADSTAAANSLMAENWVK
jgi:peptidoglycan hydrolase CwlO-like protein